MRAVVRVFAAAFVVLALVLMWGWVRPAGERGDAIEAARERGGLSLEERFVQTNGITLHVVLAGPADGTPVMLLHGLPDFWWGWHRQIGPLAAAGLRVIVPDLRGHNLSDKPESVAAYYTSVLKDDIIRLIEALGYDTVSLVGHDAGAGLAWLLAIEHPERIERIVSFGIGHPLAFRAMAQQRSVPWLTRTFYGSLRWLVRSSAPEWIASWNDWGALVALVRQGANGAFPDEDLPLYRQAWERGNSFRYMMHWYRAMFTEPLVEYTRPTRTPVPALVVALGRDLTVPQKPSRDSADFAEDVRIVELEDATHWVLQEQPERVTELILEHLATAGGAAKAITGAP
jgi:pimeloyl-ACP methyl ester carboxylesterase